MNSTNLQFFPLRKNLSLLFSPLLAALMLFVTIQLTTAQSWYALGLGANNSVRALVSYNGELYAGGSFTSAGGIGANRVAKWNGNIWSALGLGVNGRVNALIVFNGELVVAGDFTQVGGVSANRIAKWNGTNWLLLDNGSGLNNEVLALAIYNNELYAAGRFTTAGTLSAHGIARWNGSSWSAVGLGFDLPVRALAVYNSSLIAGGEFFTAGGISANRIAMWNGSNWSAMGVGVDDNVCALANVNGDLYVGGQFTHIGGVSVNRLAKWNGSWSALGIGVNGTVYSLSNLNGSLIAGGNFTTAGGVSANKIAKWNGSNWTAMGSGMSGGPSYPPQVLALGINNGLLYAGGNFTIADGITVNNIARWGVVTSVEDPAKNIPGKYKLYQNYPNPFNPSTNIRFDLPEASNVKLTVLDVTGKELVRLIDKSFIAGSYSVIFNAGNLSSGVYFYKLETGDYEQVLKMVLVK